MKDPHRYVVQECDATMMPMAAALPGQKSICNTHPTKNKTGC